MLGEHINKPVNLALQWSGLLRAYQVVSITSTVLYKPSEWLREKVVDECNTQKGWSVTMVHDQFFSNLFSSIVKLPTLAVP